MKLITLDTKGQAGADWGFIKIPAIPKVTSGSLFLGTFETDIQNTLNSTKFGNPYYSKPISVQFSLINILQGGQCIIHALIRVNAEARLLKILIQLRNGV